MIQVGSHFWKRKTLAGISVGTLIGVLVRILVVVLIRILVIVLCSVLILILIVHFFLPPEIFCGLPLWYFTRLFRIYPLL